MSSHVKACSANMPFDLKDNRGWPTYANKCVTKLEPEDLQQIAIFLHTSSEGNLKKVRVLTLYHTPRTTSDEYLQGRSKSNSAAAAAAAPETVQAATIAKASADLANL